jgi:methylmalonyl-CoA mutase cobalamin-binding subunit
MQQTAENVNLCGQIGQFGVSWDTRVVGVRLLEGGGEMARRLRHRMGVSPMRDNGSPYAEADCGPQPYAGLAQEALNRLVSVHVQGSSVVHDDHLDHLFQQLLRKDGFDPSLVLTDLLARRLDMTAVASSYVPEAARRLGECWLKDTITFVDVTVGTERLHALVREVDGRLDHATQVIGPSALILVAEAEQHTLGAFVLALHLRAEGYSAIVRVAPGAAELTQLMATNRFDLALVSMGCAAALGSGIGLVRLLRQIKGRSMAIYVGGAIPISDERLLSETGADRALRDVSTLLADYKARTVGELLDREHGTGIRPRATSVAKGDGVEP